jgi:glutamate dehydrogenase (NAD(P)+)
MLVRKEDAMQMVNNSSPGSMAPQLTIHLSDKTLGLFGRLVIDSTVNDHSLGGVRMMPDVGLDELAGLARNMTLKFGFWKIPMGGAKACILIDNKVPWKKRRQFLSNFGRNLASLLRARIYIPADDMGSRSSDIEYILASAGCRVRRGKSKAHTYTSWTMCVSAEVAASSIGMNFSDSTIAIEGFGKIGASAAKTFSEAGVKVVAISTVEGAIYNPLGLDVPRLLELKEQYGDRVVTRYPARRIDKSELFSLDVDIIAPCAGARSINSSSAKDAKCKVVCPGANVLMSDEVERFLTGRGILCIPDFVANSGAVFGGHVDSIVNEHKIREVIQTNFRKQVQDLIDLRHETNAMLGNIAREISLRRFQTTKTRMENSFLQSDGIKSFIRLLPKSIKNRLAPIYFNRVLDIR